MNRRELVRTTGTVLLAGLLVGVPRPASSQAPQAALQARIDIAVGSLPLGILVADLDGDGLLDLVATNQTSDDVSLVKGFGDGTFRQIETLAVGLRPSAAVLTDVDGDGVDDLIVSNLIGQSVSFLKGDGFGGFGAQIVSPTGGNSPGDLVVGHWDADGFPDVATVNPNTNTITRMLGDGTGRFSAALPIGTASVPKVIISDDLDGDGLVDLAVVNRNSNNLQIFYGDGAGQFSLGISLGTGSGPNDVVAADLNGDMRLDLAIADRTGDTLTVYLADAAGGYGTPATLNPGFGPRSLMAADVNADGHLDLVVTMSRVVGVGEVAILFGDGAGGFSASPIINSGPLPNSIGVGDFNRDGLADLVTTNRTGNSISFIPSVATGSFLVTGAINLPVGAFPRGVVVADFNNDSKADVATANSATDNISVAAGDGAGGFTSVNSSNRVGITPFSIVALDFNLDTDIDLVSANQGDDTISYLQGNGAGNFTVTNGLDSGCEDGTAAIGAGDISGDGITDLAVACEVSDRICTRIGTGGTGASAFGAPVCIPAGQTPSSIGIGFFNLDALEDIAWAAFDQNILQVAISDGAGSFLDIPTDFPVGAEPKGVISADINGDGFADLIVANSGSESISVLLGDGGGIFSFPSIDSSAGEAPTALAVADFNLDGLQDIAVTNTNGNNVSLLLGDGFGNFSNAGNFGTRDQPIAVDVGDFDLDGRPDLAVADDFSDTVTILINLSIPGDPLERFSLLGSPDRTIFRWGLVPGAVYDLIRGEVALVSEGPASFDFGAVTCLADDLTVTDTVGIPETGLPPPGTLYFYAVRAVVGGVPGDYSVATNGKPGNPSSGDCL